MSADKSKFEYDIWWAGSEWKEGYWYPLPLGQDVEFDGKEITVPGSWDLFRLDSKFKKGDTLYGDIDGMGLDLTFHEAVKVANRINPEKLFTFSWAKELE